MPSDATAFGFQNLLPRELDEGQHPVPAVPARWVMEHLDVIEHILAGFLVSPKMSPGRDLESAMKSGQ